MANIKDIIENDSGAVVTAFDGTTVGYQHPEITPNELNEKDVSTFTCTNIENYIASVQSESTVNNSTKPDVFSLLINNESKDRLTDVTEKQNEIGTGTHGAELSSKKEVVLTTKDSEILGKFEGMVHPEEMGRDKNVSSFNVTKQKDFLSEIGAESSAQAIEAITNAEHRVTNLAKGFSQTTSIHDLPNELLTYTFSFLDVKQRIQLELVCRRWQVIGQEIPWRYPRKLHFTSESAITSQHVPINMITHKDMYLILRRCGSCLKELVLSNKCKSNIHLTSEAIIIIGQCCSNLEVLKLAIPVNNSTCLQAIAFGCPKLKVVQISNFGNTNHEEGVLGIVRRCHVLQSLEVTNVLVGSKWFDVVNPDLRKLCLSKCTVYSMALRNLTARCHRVQHLELLFVVFTGDLVDGNEYGCTLIDALYHFQDSLNTLKFKNVDLDWYRILGNIKNLEELSLASCRFVQDDLMDLIAREYNHLEVLDISNSDVTDGGLISLAALPSLKKLDVSYTHIAGDGLQVLATVGNLEVVVMQGMENIVEESVCCLAKLCKNLSVLDVSGTTRITKKLVLSFCDALKTRDLRGPVMLFVGDTSIRRNVETCPGLQLLLTSSASIGSLS